MTFAENMPTAEELEIRVSALEKRGRIMLERYIVDGESSLQKTAEYLALFEGVIEIAQKVGIEDFGKHLEDLKKKHHHTLLKNIESFDPWAAGLLDTRNVEDSTDDSD